MGLDSFMCVPWFIHICAMTHIYVCHDSFMSWNESGSWLIHICATIHSYVCHDPFISALGLIHICEITNSQFPYVICMNESCPMYEWVMSHIWLSHEITNSQFPYVICLVIYLWHDGPKNHSIFCFFSLQKINQVFLSFSLQKNLSFFFLLGDLQLRWRPTFSCKAQSSAKELYVSAKEP